MEPYKNFISFEGIDFSGKTTQIQQLMNRLRNMNLNIHLLREPGGTVISEKIRHLLLDNSHQEMHPRTEILLYSAARAQLVHQTIIPLLDVGEYVIADRFFDSTTAYQGHGRHLDISFVELLNQFATSGLVPYKTFFIDISPDEALRRRKEADRQNDRLESENLAFYQTIRQSYLNLANQFADRFIVIPGEMGIEEISQLIWKEIVNIWNISG